MKRLLTALLFSLLSVTAIAQRANFTLLQGREGVLKCSLRFVAQSGKIESVELVDSSATKPVPLRIVDTDKYGFWLISPKAQSRNERLYIQVEPKSLISIDVNYHWFGSFIWQSNTQPGYLTESESFALLKSVCRKTATLPYIR